MSRSQINEWKRLEARVEGVVQGVGYRVFVLREARRLGLRGWVRNRADGSVEAVAEGPQEELRELETVLRRGPAGAVVRDLHSRWSDATGEFTGFEVR
jgi:acylphosphatase